MEARESKRPILVLTLLPPHRTLMVPMSPRTALCMLSALVMAASCGGAISGQPDAGAGGDAGGSGSGSGVGASSSGSASGGSSSSGGSGSNSGGSTSSGGGSGSGSSSSGSSSGSSGSSSGANCSGSGSGAGVSCCWSQGGSTPAQHQQCVWQCCPQVDPADAMTYLAAAQACLCGSGGVGPCSSACATEFCMNGTFASFGDACGNCVQQALSGSCASVNKCGSGCGYYSECITGCP